MLEQEVKELTAAMKENTEALRQVIAGRDEAMKALQAQAKDETPARRTRAKKDEPAAEKQETAPKAVETKAPSWNPDISVAGMRSLVGDYVNQTEDAEGKAARTANVKAVLAHLGADVVNPIESKPDAKPIDGDDNRRQAAFFITRFANGLPVDFNAEYDFDADPLTQGDLEPAAEPAAEEDDILG